MKNSLPIILGVGAIAAFVLFSGKPAPVTTSTTPKKKPDLKVGDIEAPTPKPKNGGIKLAGTTTPQSCNKDVEYYDSKTKKCVKFWTPGVTDKEVEQKIRDLLDVFSSFDITDVCVIPELITMNSTALAIVKETINSIWNIPLELLPPTKAKQSPEWMIILWDKVADIYQDVACG